MTTYSDVFGGSTVQPSDVQYRAVALSADITTVWPAFATTGNELARIMRVTPSVGSISITLPDATLGSAGADVLFDNAGAFSFSVLDAAGGSVATVAPGQVKYIYMSSSSTSAGTWGVTLFGASSSNLDASQLAGAGLKAVGSTLAQSCLTSTISADTTFTSADRSQLFVNTGGSITTTLPLTSTVGNDFFIELRNQGSGTMTVAPVGGETIDDSVTITLQVNEACLVQAGSSAWYTVGRGRNTQFNFSLLAKTVTGGTDTLTLTEASNVVQTYSGTLTSNEIVVLPSVVQVYYIFNNTVGSYSFTIKSPNVGSVLLLPQGQSAVVFCDGTNVTNASTSVSGFTSMLLGAGTAASPSLAFVSASNGIYAPSSTTVAITPNGVEATRWAAGQQLSVDGTAAAPPYSFNLSATTGAYSPAADQWAVSAAGTQKLLVTPSGVTLVTPALGTPVSGNFSSGTFTWPTFNQNTSGYAEALKSATTTVSVSAATAPSNGQVLTATSSTTATWQTPTGVTFVDTNPIVKGSVDATKQIRFEVDGLTTATTRVITPPDADITLVGTANTQTLTNKTLTGYTETVYALSGTAIDPANGTVQTKTLSGNTTFTESLADGQSVVLMLNPATYTTTWPGGTTWINTAGSGSAPTLEASTTNVIVMWQVAGTLYANWVGSA